MAPENKNFSSPGQLVASEGGDLSQTMDFFAGAKSGNDELALSLSEEGGDEGDEEGEPEGEESAEESEGEPSEEDEGEDEDVDSEDEEEEGDEGDEESQQARSEKTRNVKVKVGDDELDIPSSAKIPVLVDGKLKHATLQDLRNIYASKASIASDLQVSKQERETLRNEKREWAKRQEKSQQDLAEMQGFRTDLKKTLEDGNIDQTINMLCFELGVDAAAYWDRLEPILAAYFAGDGKNDGWAALDHNARVAISNQRRADIRERENKLRTQKEDVRRQNEQFANTRALILEKAGLTMDEIEDAFARADKDAQAGKWKPEDIEAFRKAPAIERFKIIAAIAMGDKLRGKVAGVIERRFPNLKGKAAHIALELEKVMGYEFLGKATDKNIADLISNVYSKSNSTGAAGGKPGKKKSAKTSLSDKATPRHKVEKAAETDDDEEEDLYAQEGGSRSSQVWGGQFKTFT